MKPPQNVIDKLMEVYMMLSDCCGPDGYNVTILLSQPGTIQPQVVSVMTSLDDPPRDVMCIAGQMAIHHRQGEIEEHVYGDDGKEIPPHAGPEFSAN